MTLQDLKDNREEIINLIAIHSDTIRTKELMSLMVSSIGCRAYEGLSVKNFAMAVIKDNPAKLIITDSTAYYAAESLKQLSSSMR